MSKISLQDWTITDKSIRPSKRKVTLRVYNVYPDLNQYIHLPPKERIKHRDEELRKRYTELKKYFGPQIIKKIGNHKSPRGAVIETNMSALKKIAKFNFIESTYIESIGGAVKKVTPPETKFWCVKAIVAIQVEGIRKGMQSYEERFTLVKAFTEEEAITKAEKEYEIYAEPYFNPYGNRVRWKLEKIIDVYETYITDSNELDKEEAVEIYSILNKRRLTPEYTWDGKE